MTQEHIASRKNLKAEEFEPILTNSEVCKILRCSGRSFYRMVKAGRLMGFKVGSTWRVKSSELQNYIDRKSQRRQ
jgi:excisionase family DNA binding protein